MSESIFQGVELMNANGDRVQGEDAVRDKVLALYFSAEWCPYCQELQPELNKLYEAVNAEKPQLEIIFVSSDNSEDDHLAYFKKHGPWWTIPFDDELRNDLKRKYLVAARKEQEQVGVSERLGGLPTLLIIKPDGDVIARDGVERVKEDVEGAGGSLHTRSQLNHVGHSRKKITWRTRRTSADHPPQQHQRTTRLRSTNNSSVAPFSTMSESFLHGVELVNAKGDKSAGEDVARGKVLALYFAADWCPDCRAFQPTLNKFYKEVNAETQQLELVFVGSDSTQEDQTAHFKDKQGPWWAIPFESSLRSELKRKYGVCAGKEQREVGVAERKGGIPSLVVVKPDGALIDLHGAENVEKDGVSALNKWL